VSEPTWDDGFDAGYRAGIELAVTTCNERAAKHKRRGTRLAQDHQSEANACASAVRMASAKKAQIYAKAKERVVLS
jgi:hypothetical protein